MAAIPPSTEYEVSDDEARICWSLVFSSPVRISDADAAGIVSRYVEEKKSVLERARAGYWRHAGLTVDEHGRVDGRFPKRLSLKTRRKIREFVAKNVRKAP